MKSKVERDGWIWEGLGGGVRVNMIKICHTKELINAILKRSL